MEAALGASFAAVRVHQDAYAQAIGAQAFTRGTDIFFAPGRFDPGSPQGLELIGHELAHVKQQAEGRVQVTAQIDGSPANDDPALEREADDLGAKAARGAHAQGPSPQAGPGLLTAGAPAAPDNRAPAQAKADADAGDAAPPGAQPRVEALADPQATDALDEGAVSLAPIQRTPGQAQKGPKARKDFIAFQIAVGKPMTREEFEAAANLQVFGATATGSKILPNESGKAELWRSIRDEVLFQHQYLASLPDKVKALIHVSIQGRDLTPADYDQLFRIARKIAALPPGAVADYARKITGSTPDLGAFEAAIDGYRGELAERERADAERTAVQNKLLGLEEVYTLYREYLTTPIEAAPPGMRERLEQQLVRYGFASTAEFAAYIARFEKAFEDGAVRITLDLLARYAGKLYQESQRYQDPAVVKDLHARLGGFRTQFQAFDRNARIWNDHAAQANRDSEQGRLPGNGHIHARAADARASRRRREGQGSQGQRRGADQGPLEGPSDLRRG